MHRLETCECSFLKCDITDKLQSQHVRLLLYLLWLSHIPVSRSANERRYGFYFNHDGFSSLLLFVPLNSSLHGWLCCLYGNLSKQPVVQVHKAFTPVSKSDWLVVKALWINSCSLDCMLTLYLSERFGLLRAWWTDFWHFWADPKNLLMPGLVGFEV